MTQARHCVSACSWPCRPVEAERVGGRGMFKCEDGNGSERGSVRNHMTASADSALPAIAPRSEAQLPATYPSTTRVRVSREQHTSSAELVWMNGQWEVSENKSQTNAARAAQSSACSNREAAESSNRHHHLSRPVQLVCGTSRLLSLSLNGMPEKFPVSSSTAL